MHPDADPLTEFEKAVIACTRCPRLRIHRERVAREKVRRFAGFGLLGETRARLRGPAGRGSWCWAWPRRPMAATALDGCLPATAAANGCSVRCMPPVLPIDPIRSTAATASDYTTAMSPPRSAARPPATNPCATSSMPADVPCPGTDLAGASTGGRGARPTRVPRLPSTRAAPWRARSHRPCPGSNTGTAWTSGT